MKRVLIDTHVFIWLDENSPRVPGNVLAALLEPKTRALLSVASPWEMAIKIASGKLAMKRALGVMLEDYLGRGRIELVQPSVRHFEILATMPRHHGDPFDRLIAAQALAEELPLITADSVFERYGVRRVWD